jgi:hypothetical protein
MTNTLKANIKKTGRKIAVKIDASRFERLAAVFGMFNSAFLASLVRAESDYRAGRTKSIRSLKELR